MKLKMAEVGQRLTGAAYRLSAITGGHSRSVVLGESPGPPLASSTAAESRLGEKPRLEYKIKTSTARKWSKLYRVRRSESWTVLYSKCLLQESDSSESLHTTPAGSAARMTTWTKALPSQHDLFRSSEQLRTFCTVVSILTEQAPGSGLRRPTTGPAHFSSRSYSWKSDSKDAPMYRSRTAYYDLLRISPNATQSQIKTAYYKQSLIHHPDKNPGDPDTTQRFSEISEAYTVLGDVNLRRKYDRGLLSQFDLQSAGRPSSTAAPQRQQSSRRFSRAGGKTMFDFDAFYKAHYGEQLQREREMRARKEEMERQCEERMKKRREQRMKDMTLVVVMAAAGLVFFNLSRS